ncbi:GH39 family glycosyl hydrolase [Streptomyces sp. G45]|uniref:GH39 family glycosyl hydrolase n=1 Tax=Streptomyces sp. G45 TaxID=3406627 RepID=UPI003C2A39DB
MRRHGWSSDARRWRVAALLGVGVVAVALVLTVLTMPGKDRDGTAGPSRNGDRVHGTPADPPGRRAAEVGWGFTHTQHSADQGEDAAVGRAEKLLKGQRRPLPQIQHLMGWGAGNPEPARGRYDFADLDRRVDFVRATRGTPVLTLCCAPDWMKGGEPGAENTDWSKASLETAPEPEHYDDFAALAATVAKRYPDVRHFVVWNEMKGFWNSTERRWDYEGYTALYNKVYRALKRVDKDIMVGGPYVIMDSVRPRQGDGASEEVKGPWGSLDQGAVDAFDYWNEHKAGADFVVVDGASYTKDDELLPDEFRAADKFTAVGRWLRERTGGLPLWWAEYYVEPADDRDNRDAWPEPHRVAVHATSLIAMARGGATSGFYWNPQRRDGACAGCLWSSTHLPDGGRELPILRLLARFAEAFPPGTRYEKVSVGPGDVPNVRVLADDEAVLVVNVTDRTISAEVDGGRYDLGAYEVKWLKR